MKAAAFQQLLPLLAATATLVSAAYESDVLHFSKPWRRGGSSSSLFADFDWDKELPSKSASSLSSSAAFASILQSSKSDSKRSRSEEVKQEVRTHSQSSQWTRGFQDNGRGGLTRLDSVSSAEKTTGRSAKELKASESGESAQRERKLTRVGGKTVVSTDAGKQSSFSNSGHLANRTKFSSESSSSDNNLAKVVLPPKPPHPSQKTLPPSPALVACIDRSDVSIFFLVHASTKADSLDHLIGFLDVFLTRMEPERVVVIFFNRRVLDVVDSAEHPRGSLLRHLDKVSRGLQGFLADECNLPAAAAAARHHRHRQPLITAGPSVLVALMASGDLHFDDRVLVEARAVATPVQHDFKQATPVVPLGLELEPRVVDLLLRFSTDRPPALLPLEFGGGFDTDSQSADVLGRRVCEAVEPEF